MAEFGPVDQLRHRAARFVAAAPVRLAPMRGVLSLSFDDFPASAWTEAAPVLAQHGVLATYYLCGGLCGVERLGLPQFSLAHAQAAVAARHELGCHTFGHESVLSLTAAGLTASLDRNAAWVAERLDGYAMTTFAYPFGHLSAGAKRTVARRFALGRGVRDGVNGGMNGGRADRAALRAIGLEARRLPGYDLDALCAEAAARRGWLIAYGHDVGDAPSPYGCTPRDLERLILAAREAGLAVLPVAAAYAAMSPEARAAA